MHLSLSWATSARRILQVKSNLILKVYLGKVHGTRDTYLLERTWDQRHPNPPPDRMTHSCENVTFPQTSLLGCKMCFVERNLQRAQHIATCTVGEKQLLCFNRILHYPDNNPDFPTFLTTSYHYSNKIYQHKAGRATSCYLPFLFTFPTPLISLPGEDNAKQLYQF